MSAASAIILSDCGDAATVKKTARLLEFFGVPARVLNTAELWLEVEMAKEKLVVFCEPKTFCRLAKEIENDSNCRALWQSRVHSAFVSGEGIAELVTGFSNIEVVESRAEIFSVAENLDDVCGVMAGVRCGVEAVKTKKIFVLKSAAASSLISNADGAAFAKLDFHGATVCVSTATELVDLDQPLPARVFDVRPHFLSAVPIVLFIKWSLATNCWQPPETTACLVIDDPRLMPRYGFLNFEHLLGLMKRANFSTSIAFIPWNCNRSRRRTVRLFQENPQRLSLSVHGCDHTAGEYGSRNRDRLAWKSRQAMQRMSRHQSRTGLAHDPVMVFPQGVFSEAAMAALKHADFIGVVNSEVISTDPQPRTITVGDYWGVAVMNYSDFPIFTRRYPSAGIENFAFDVLLGKPCLVVTHHNDFHDDYRYLLNCIEGLNRLKTAVRWTNLAEVARRSFRQREIIHGVMEVEFFASEVRLENLTAGKKLFRLRKRESEPVSIREIKLDSQPVKWGVTGNHIELELTLNPGEQKTVSVQYQPATENKFPGENLRYRLKAMVRRYLCDIRDNYVMRKSFSQ